VDALLEITDGVADLVLEDGDVKPDLGLRTATLISLFTDALARPEDAPWMGRRGWCAQRAGEDFGSRLWTLERSRASSEVLERARAHTKACLAWAVDVGAAASVDVSAVYVRPEQMGIAIRIKPGNGRRWLTLDSSQYEVQLGGKSFQILRG
jgi:phage gp46-like protein